MKRITRLMLCTAVTAGLTAQVASAGVLFTNQVQNVKGIGLKVVYPGTFSRSYDKPGIRCFDRTGELNKLWIGWDLSAAWAIYGQSNLVDSSFTYWGENGTTRGFWVAALDNGTELDNWGQDTIHWTNAPGNLHWTNALGEYYDPGTGPLRCAFDSTKIYGGTNIWECNNGSPGIVVNLANPNFGGTIDQAARYTSTDVVNSGLTTWLATDTDGWVTLMASGLNNQNWWVGTNGAYANDLALGYFSTQPESFGEPSRGSPTLTLVFDVRVALTGGGTICAGDPGLEISMAGTDVGYDYLLYTNGVYAATVAGTGSAVSFGLWTASAVYTAVASNTTTTATYPVPSNAAIFIPPAPTFTAQPTSYTSAVNSIAMFTVSTTGSGGGIGWYRNGVALTDDGHYSGTATEQLIISPVLASDAATTADGYYCVITNSCGVTLSSTTNALIVQTARNLVWRGTPANTWDIATTANWFNSGTSSADTFEQGDNVLLDDTALTTDVLAADRYLSPGTITFNASGLMGIGASGLGDISGPNSKLVVNNPVGQLVISNANSFGGGTTINDGWLIIRRNDSIGTGTVTLAGTGLSILEVVVSGGANVGIPGLDVLADGTVQFDAGGAYSGSILGPITGTAGKTLRMYRSGGVAGDNIRVWNNDFTCDANINLDIGSANLAPYNTGGLQTYNGVISGSGTLFTRMFSGGRMILNGANTYMGGTRFSAGTTGIGIDSVGVDFSVTSGALGTGPVTIEGNVGIFASGGPHTLGNSVVYTATGGTLTFTDTNVLTMSGTFDLGSGGITAAVNRTIAASSGTVGIISGAITDNSGLACGLIKDGSGTLLLNGVNTYNGTTTVTEGALGGTGTIAGPVVVEADGALAPGQSIGTLTINNDLTVNGALEIDVNKSAVPKNDTVQVSGALSSATGGEVIVRNLGAALSAGDKFVLFNKPMTGGAAFTVSGAGMIWANNLAVDGSIEVVGPIATTPTDISYSFSGGQLTLSWPPNYLGWSLQVQTNPLDAGLGTNWTTLGYETTTSAVITIDPASPAVFYRLFYQAP